VSRASSTLACSGCGWTPHEDEPYPFRCANAGTDDTDHVVVRTLDPKGVIWPDAVETEPFIRYRTLLSSHHRADQQGMSDADFVQLVERLDKEVAAVDGRGFTETPFGRADELSERLGFTGEGGVWVKDETGNVSGSHKARHLFGILLHLVIGENVGLVREGERRDLAIASCGNAALAAAVVAKAGGRTLRVFVPTWADEAVVRRLRGLDAVIEVCEREPGMPGDPTYSALQGAIADGALPFTCQGNENGLAIEGGETLGYEMVSTLLQTGRKLDRVFVQVGGGALASAVLAAFREAHELGALARMPTFHAVQTEGGHPLKRAYDLVAERILGGIEADSGDRPEDAEDEATRARFIADHLDSPAVERELRSAARHRSEYMWPWDDEPKSIAHGILDDETYDWLAVVRGLIETGGYPVTVDEVTLERANELGRMTTRIDVDHTGTAGLAGLMASLDGQEVSRDERVAVLFTGARR
jgi:threonine synthase